MELPPSSPSLSLRLSPPTAISTRPGRLLGRSPRRDGARSQRSPAPSRVSYSQSGLRKYVSGVKFYRRTGRWVSRIWVYDHQVQGLAFIRLNWALMIIGSVAAAAPCTSSRRLYVMWINQSSESRDQKMNMMTEQYQKFMDVSCWTNGRTADCCHLFKVFSNIT